ncbi:hydroxymethylglutaryl-CoA reductase [Salinibacter sp. 10B]|uniref:hydroxymethylglutaryl-CoA reductase n=1 Tax=Salinibacter sp. 10B TaxID=1923971 RepID=UPI000CF40E27|nr:hydroxymethylglutaryl-CoA reductase [Salinibacter sp. 10B]PQJ36105.1 hydroxymethylglutaryl-CoA reductase [Salinibacter sp. 10B]
MFVPSALLKQLYTFGSLENTDQGVEFALKNRLKDATLTELIDVTIDGTSVPHDDVHLFMGDGDTYTAQEISSDNSIDFPLRRTLHLRVDHPTLESGKHKIELSFRAKPFGKLSFAVEDSISEQNDTIQRIPRDPDDNYSQAIIDKRQQFVADYSDTSLDHVTHYSFDPHTTEGNVENFTGVAQIPLGFAGPLTVNGEHATDDFLIPLATSEGTLVASYNRGIKVCNLSGGVKSTVVEDAMQRAPVFVFDDAREARDFTHWVEDHMDEIREEAESTSSVATLLNIDQYLSNNFAYLRFNYETGDAAGQNMVGRATFTACGWIIDQYPHDVKHFYLESNFATDKKASQVNVMNTRGKRVTAEATIEREALIQHMRVEPESLHYHWNVSTVGAFLSGANNNGAHSPNAITAMFIATGQDVANVSESSAGVLYTDLTEDGDLYISLTIPSLIVATYGGGTSLATQRECLEVMDCYGKGKVKKFAEVVAGAALAGELSLGAAISSSDWVSSHETYGRNR